MQGSPQNDSRSLQLDAELEDTLSAMEASFQVRLISTFGDALQCAPANANVGEWLELASKDYDQFPVRDDKETIGVLLRNSRTTAGTVREAMEPLRDGLIVSADMPIQDLIRELQDHHFRLVLRKERIDGLVTQSDLLKLPVRMLLFGLTTHLESGLRNLIRARAPWPQWLERVDKGRRKTIEDDLKKLKDDKREPDPLELTYLRDALTILEDDPEVGPALKAAGKSLKILRNDIAHGKDFVGPPTNFKSFIEVFSLVQECLVRVAAALKAPK